MTKELPSAPKVSKAEAFAREAEAAGWLVERIKVAVGLRTVDAQRGIERVVATWKRNEAGNDVQIGVEVFFDTLDLGWVCEGLVTLKTARALLISPAARRVDGELVKLPWTEDTPYPEVLVAVNGHTIWWRSTHTGKLQSAVVSGIVSIDGQGILTFTNALGYRSVRVSAIRKVI